MIRILRPGDDPDGPRGPGVITRVPIRGRRERDKTQGNVIMEAGVCICESEEGRKSREGDGETEKETERWAETGRLKDATLLA